MYYHNTVAHDLEAIRKLISFSKLQGFSTLPIYSIFRNSCVILYEIDKALQSDKVITTRIREFKNISNIRHMVKSSQGRNNRKIFQDILDSHLKIFGEDIDNVGFYFNGDILAGSTMFVTYIFSGTSLLKTLYHKNSILNFSSEIGTLVNYYQKAIGSPISLDFLTTYTTSASEYKRKDVWHKRIFANEFPHDVFIMRLLNIQNELSTCIWLKQTLNLTSSYYTLDKYIFLRFSSIITYESTKNLIDMDKYSHNYTKHMGLHNLLEDYSRTICCECKTLRDMLHYSNTSTNFYEYVEEKLSTNHNYVDDLICELNNYITKLRIIISSYLDIKSVKSMGDFELICRRIFSMFHQKKFQDK